MALKDNFRTEAIVLPPKWGVYGKHGSGKSTLALSSGKKTVVLNTDNGIEEVLHQAKGDIWVQDFIPEVKEAKGANQVSHETNSKMWLGLLDTLRDLAREKHDRQVLVIDSLDAADTLAHSHSCHELGVAAIDEVGFGKGWGRLRGNMQVLLNALSYLNREKQMEIIVVGHAQVRQVKDPTMESFDSFTLKLNKHSAQDVPEWLDALFFLAYKSIIQSTDAGFGRKDKREINTGERVLYTGGTSGAETKNRFNLPPEMPADYHELHKLINESRATSMKEAA